MVLPELNAFSSTLPAAVDLKLPELGNAFSCASEGMAKLIVSTVNTSVNLFVAFPSLLQTWRERALGFDSFVAFAFMEHAFA